MDEFNATPEAGSGHGGNGHLPTVAGESFNDPSLLTPIRRQDRDIRRSAKGLPKGQARFLVDNYYIMQRDRIRAAHQMRTLLDGGEPNDVLNWLFVQHDTLETQVKAALDTYSTSTLAGQWMRSITGIGPVMTAGLLCHINVEIAQTAGAVWRFAGLDPTQKCEKGTKRPWNGALKRLCYLIGDSFVKTKGSEKTHYGPVYEGRKAYEMRHNLAGVYAETVTAVQHYTDRLFRSAHPGADGADPLEDLDRGSRTTRAAKVEPALAEADPGQVVQFERLGYFAADLDDPSVFHRTVGLRDEWANIQKQRTA